MVYHNSDEYFFVLNAFGDVIGITDQNGALVVEYTYDVWGKQLTCTGSKASTLGKLNPLRYRSYIYDEETGLYYLQSRYYNPEIGRFINADGFVSTGQGLLGNNMFAYCHNNPVMWCDPCGSCLHRLDFWNHCEECQGKSFGERVVGYVGDIIAVHRQCQELDTQIRMEQIEVVNNAASAVWDAYQRGYAIQQEATLMEAQMMVDGTITAYNLLDETKVIDIGASSYHTVRAAQAFKKSVTYFVAPIPTVVDEAFALGFFLKGLYHSAKALWEVKK